MDDIVKLGIDLDQYTSADKDFLRIICHLLCPDHDIHLITYRDKKNKDEIVQELEKDGIQYSKLVHTDNKTEYLHNKGIEILIDEETTRQASC